MPHEFKETVTVDVWYPDHPPRKESDTFSKSRHKVIVENDTPCYVCGSKDKRELHHYFVEWAFSEAVDWDKMKALHPTFDWATFKGPEDFVDSEYNMMVLCETHHRLKDHGIHNLPFPIWQVQKIIKDDFKLFGGMLQSMSEGASPVPTSAEPTSETE